jgi:hypothetical protein
MKHLFFYRPLDMLLQRKYRKVLDFRSICLANLQKIKRIGCSLGCFVGINFRLQLLKKEAVLYYCVVV